MLAHLKNNDLLIQELAELILSEHFPGSIHQDILEEVGLELSIRQKRKRDPNFRDKILKAYEYSCAVCGFNVRLGNNLVAIDAAHIQWHQAGGPDTEENGVALCSMHHKLFDRGVFTISEERELLVAEQAHGTNGFDEWLMKFHGKMLRSLINPIYMPKMYYLNWHIRERRLLLEWLPVSPSFKVE
nr:HNH endonuclease [Paenibacillus sp. R14(2021)]